MREYMKIVEVFDRPRPLTWQRPGKGEQRAVFEVESEHFEVRFFEMDDYPDEWEIDFVHVNSSTGGRSWDNTGKSATSSGRVFATAISCIEGFLDSWEPKELIFGGVKAKIGPFGTDRSQLYSAMARVMRPRLTAMRYSIGETDKGHSTFFTIKREYELPE